jgi:hypothetical protein
VSRRTATLGFLAVLAALPVGLTGCSLTPADVGLDAACGHPEERTRPTLALMAQSVPTASLIPCVQLIPAGWTLDDITAASGRSTLVLNSDRDGPRALTVELTASCDTTGATPVPSDQAGARRYERPERITSGYVGRRYYVYPGGCTTYRFDLHGASQAQPVNEASLAIGFTTRDVIRTATLRDTGGRYPLDPPTAKAQKP